MDPEVAELLRELRHGVEAAPGDAAAWGRFGMACEANGQLGCARDAYGAAVRLAPKEPRWWYALALVQSTGFVFALHQGSGGLIGFGASLPEGIDFIPGFNFWRAGLIVLVWTAGTALVMWIGELITQRGIGNGMSLLIFFSIIEGFPGAIGRTLEALTTGVIGPVRVVILLAVMVGVVAGVVAMTMASRKIPVQIPRKVMGRGRIREGQKSFIPLRINSAGVMPIIFAQSIIIVPGTIAAFSNIGPLQGLAQTFQPGSWWYYGSYALLILFFTYFYTSIIFNPVDLAENLKKQGAFIPGVKPGARTAEYIDRVLTRISFPGALFLAGIAIVPLLLLDAFGVPFLGNVLSGTGLLIVVGVALDTVQQAQQHLLLRRYEGFMKKGRVRFRGRNQTT